MKNFVLLAGITLLTSCSTHNQSQSVGMANPASVHCEKVGGKLDIVEEQSGQVGYCTLPSGERIEEWSLFRRDNDRQ